MTRDEVRRHNRIANAGLLGFLVFLVAGMALTVSGMFLVGVPMLVLSFVSARAYVRHAGIVWDWIDNVDWRP